MPVTVRRLGPGDEDVLALLAREDADFDLDGRSGSAEPLGAEHARRFLANPAVLQWIAAEGDHVVGLLLCIIVPLRSGAGEELLLYEIGVRSAWRRRGVGRALLDAMERWMRDHAIDEVWVLGDNAGAVEFYRACGFAPEMPQPTYLLRTLSDGAAG
ncbi:MAG: GNAT family N-acetyltransferase [Gemmatirosa sp.]|nr:GNAT family N-acetyltransferase [Gemmatirosa sp.]